MRVEVEAPGGARVDLATELFVETRERAPRAVCDAWRMPTASTTLAIDAGALSGATAPTTSATNNVAPAAEEAFDERQLCGPWDFFLSHKQANGGDQVRPWHVPRRSARSCPAIRVLTATHSPPPPPPPSLATFCLPALS